MQQLKTSDHHWHFHVEEKAKLVLVRVCLFGDITMEYLFTELEWLSFRDCVRDTTAELVRPSKS